MHHSVAVSMLVTTAVFLSQARAAERIAVPEPIEARLLKARKNHSKVFASAEIDFRRLIIPADDVKKLDRAQVDAIFNSLDLAAKTDNLREFAQKISAAADVGDEPWTKERLLVQASLIRHESPRGLHQLDEGREITSANRGRQLNIFKRGDCTQAMLTLHDFRQSPPMLVGADTTYDRTTDRVIIRRGIPAATDKPPRIEVETVVDATTATVVSQTVRDAVTKQVLNENIYKAFASYPNGIVFPMVALTATYEKDSLRHITVTVVTKAIFGEPIQASAFTIPAIVGDIVVDYRKNKEEPRVVKCYMAAADVEDVVNLR